MPAPDRRTRPVHFDRDSGDRPPLPNAGYVEDFTVPFLVAAGVLCFVVLFALWSVAGLPAMLILAFLADRVINWF